jgi:hypothetical protein
VRLTDSSKAKVTMLFLRADLVPRRANNFNAEKRREAVQSDLDSKGRFFMYSRDEGNKARPWLVSQAGVPRQKFGAIGVNPQVFVGPKLPHGARLLTRQTTYS